MYYGVTLALMQHVMCQYIGLNLSNTCNKVQWLPLKKKKNTKIQWNESTNEQNMEILQFSVSKLWLGVNVLSYICLYFVTWTFAQVRSPKCHITLHQDEKLLLPVKTACKDTSVPTSSFQPPHSLSLTTTTRITDSLTTNKLVSSTIKYRYCSGRPNNTSENSCRVY